MAFFDCISPRKYYCETCKELKGMVEIALCFYFLHRIRNGDFEKAQEEWRQYKKSKKRDMFSLGKTEWRKRDLLK